MPETVLDLSGIETVYPPTTRVADSFAQALFGHSSQQSITTLKALLSQYTGVDAGRILVTSGEDDLLTLLLTNLMGKGDYIAVPEPSLGTHRFQAEATGVGVLDTGRDKQFRVLTDSLLSVATAPEVKMIFLASPNNPTGTLTSPKTIQRILDVQKLTVIDETYFEFSHQSCIGLLASHPNLVILRSFKWAAMAAYKIAYAVAAPEIVARLEATLPGTLVSPMAISAACSSLEDQALLLRNVKRLIEERDRLYETLHHISGVHPFASQANFLYCLFPGRDGRQVANALFRQGVKVKHYTGSVYQSGIRVRIGFPDDNERFLSALRTVLTEIPTGNEPG
ncbi:MAG TPA: histidinol-phosphate transaminase [Acidobacteriota bacterium]|nr:histidinol-phosphate transaminase [Acidobacteriota bacterium]HMZ79106.1 histidinol-phosphate transaminase [Acidobacteriota bacterium]HNB72695.1 histidinol-phosphate transaminase [Acidobacteriota bacterium]HNG93769.1 histidinol-phosphate transaminase [Acidobacteriota bacterium]HNJ42069.1 histidinol-phosphate transaminase [Acidobacteriota bacterium]